MAPMIDIQRRHAEVFRVRLGDKDGNRPRKLTDQIRITARSEQIVQAFVDVYGGEVTPWENQYQAYLPTTELRILVLPGQSIQQWWEKYRGSVCERRCDGYQEQKSGNRCMCPEDIAQRAEDKDSCSPMTRVNVLCPDVNVVGAGSLVTHSMIAAETLPQSIAVAETALSQGLMVPAVLRIVLNDKGRNHFIYPQIEIVGTSMNALAAGNGGGQASLPHATDTPLAELEEAKPPLTPVPSSLPEGPQQSIADQSRPPQPRPKRKGSAPELPPSGRRRRPDADGPPAAAPEAGDDLEGMSHSQLREECKRLGLKVSGKKGDLAARIREARQQAPGSARDGADEGDTPAQDQPDAPPPPDDPEDPHAPSSGRQHLQTDPGTIRKPQLQRIQIRMRELGMRGDSGSSTDHLYRAAMRSAYQDRNSVSELSEQEASALIRVLEEGQITREGERRTPEDFAARFLEVGAAQIDAEDQADVEPGEEAADA